MSVSVNRHLTAIFSQYEAWRLSNGFSRINLWGFFCCRGSGTWPTFREPSTPSGAKIVLKDNQSWVVGRQQPGGYTQKTVGRIFNCEGKCESHSERHDLKKLALMRGCGSAHHVKQWIECRFAYCRTFGPHLRVFINGNSREIWLSAICRNVYSSAAEREGRECTSHNGPLPTASLKTHPVSVWAP